MRRFGALCYGLLAPTLAGCALSARDQEATSVSENAIQIPGTVPDLPGTTVGGVARPPDSPHLGAGATAIHGASYLNGKALHGANLDSSWTNGSLRGDEFSASSQWPEQTAKAAEFADDYVGAVEQGASWLTKLSSILPGAKAKAWEKRTNASKPERARWLKKQLVPEKCIPGQSGPDCEQGHREYSYADPMHFDEVRDRGARLYCAARRTFERELQSGYSGFMRTTNAGSFSIGNNRIELLKFSPSAWIDAPRKFVNPSSSDDQASAFAIPMQVGFQLTPLEITSNGKTVFDPKLPELRTPVVFTTADSEVQTQSDYATNIATLHALCGGACAPNPTGTCIPRCWDEVQRVNQHKKVWMTASHADAFYTGFRSIDIRTPRIPLFRYGPLSVGLTILFGLYHGGDNQLYGSKLLSAAPSGWPSAREGGLTKDPPPQSDRSEGTAFSFHSDRPWTLTNYAPISGLIGVNTNDSSRTYPVQSFQLPEHSPFLTRALQDNDKTQLIRNGVMLGAELDGAVGVSIGSFLEASGGVFGGIKGRVELTHSIRESLDLGFRQGPRSEEFPGVPLPYPETSLAIAPAVTGGIELGIGAWTKLALKLASRKITIFDFRVEQYWPVWTSPLDLWDENYRLRVTTATSRKVAMETPGEIREGSSLARSHLPNQQAFDSFGSGFHLDECVAAPEDQRSIPQALEGSLEHRQALDPESPAYAAEGMALCAYFPPEWTGEFTPVPAANREQQVCLDNLSSFLGRGISKTQAWSFSYYDPSTAATSTTRYPLSVRARVVVDKKGVLLSSDELDSVISQCKTAFRLDSRTELAKTLLLFEFCDSDATLKKVRDLIDPGFDYVQVQPTHVENRCLFSDDGKVVQKNCARSTDNQWKLVALAVGDVDLPEDDTQGGQVRAEDTVVQLKNRASSLCAAIGADGAIVEQACDKFRSEQQFVSKLDASRGTYVLQNRQQDKCLNVPRSASADGTQLIAYQCSPTTRNMVFRFAPVPR